MAGYCATCFGMQVPFAGSGIVPGGQHCPHNVTWLGSQHAPSIVMPSLGFEHGVTHLPFILTARFLSPEFLARKPGKSG